jgi:hypothetical protein
MKIIDRRGLRSFTIGVSEDDLRVIAKHGYEGALSTDDEQQAQAVSALSPTRSPPDWTGNGVTTVATPFE